MRKPRWWASAPTAALTVALARGAVRAHVVGAERSRRHTRSPTRYPNDPVKSGLGLVLKEYHQFPKTDPFPAPTDKRLMRHARINFIGEVPDGSASQVRAGPERPAVPARRQEAAPLPRRQGAVPRLLLRARDGQRLRVRDLRSEVRADRQVLHRPHRAVRGHRHQADDVPARSRTRSSTASSPSGPPTTRTRTRSSARAARSCGSASAHRSTASSRSPSTRPREGGTRTTGCCTSPSVMAGIGVGTDVPQEMGTPYGKILRIDPERDERPERGVRHPRLEPVRRRAGRDRRDLRARHARPAPVHLGPRWQAPDVPRPHRSARHRVGLRGARR